jgi:hypothetical protein
MSGFGLFAPNARVLGQSRQLRGPPFGSLAAQTIGTGIPLKGIVKFARFQHVGGCCGDVHSPTSPLLSPLLRRLFANHMRYCQLKDLEDKKRLLSKHTDWSSHQISQAGRQAGRTHHT